MSPILSGTRPELGSQNQQTGTSLQPATAHFNIVLQSLVKHHQQLFIFTSFKCINRLYF